MRVDALGRPALEGRVIGMTRAAGRADGLVSAVQQLGGIARPFPLIDFRAATPGGAFDAALARLVEYEWIVFTSATAVAAFAERLSPEAVSKARANQSNGPRFAAVGPATAAALTARLRAPDLVAVRANAAGLGAELVQLAGGAVLFPAADIASAALPDALRAAGIRTDVVTAYHTVPGAGIAALGAALATRELDALVFTSPSAVRYLVEGLRARDILTQDAWPVVFCIGPATADAACAYDVPVTAVASESTTAGLVARLSAWFAVMEDANDDDS